MSYLLSSHEDPGVESVMVVILVSVSRTGQMVPEFEERQPLVHLK